MMCLSYGAAEVGVATAKSPCGPYAYKSSFKPLGADSRDMGLFQDGETFHPSFLHDDADLVLDDGIYALYLLKVQ